MIIWSSVDLGIWCSRCPSWRSKTEALNAAQSREAPPVWPAEGILIKKLYWPLIVAIVAIVAIIVATISIFVFHHWHCLYLWSDCARVEASQDLLRMVGNRLVIMITTWMIITLKIISFTMSPFKSFQNIFECRSKVNHIVDPYLHRLPCLR